MDLVDEVIKWSEKADPKQVDKWLCFAKRYMEEWGWNKKAINDWLDWGKYGFNNNLLHLETTAESFYGEVVYCSDRMCLDRLFRCHVKYRTLITK